MASLLSSLFSKQQPLILRSTSINKQSSSSTRQSNISYLSFIWKILLPGLTLLWLVVVVFSRPTSASPPASISTSNQRGKLNSPASSLSITAGALRGASRLKSFSNVIGQKTIQSSDNIIANRNRESSSVNPIDHNNPDLTHLDHLVIVTGHAVMRIDRVKDAARDDNAWWLLAYQRDQDFPSIITSHVQTGVSLALADPLAMLIFSGGQTRRDVGPTSEAASYYYLAEQMTWLSGGMADRTFLEEHARDSFENMLFSICRFKELTKSYPKKISIVGFDFKSQRFTDIHRRAISFPENNFTYIGVKTVGKFDHQRAVNGELEVLKSFGNDIYGCSDPSLSTKREKRNPFRRTIPYELSCPELKGLFNWCGPDLYSGPLPWSPLANQGRDGNIDVTSGGNENEINHRDFKDPTWESIKD